MNRYLKIGLVLSCCVWWEAQAFSQVKIRFGETCRQEEIQVGFREQVYKIKLDELGSQSNQHIFEQFVFKRPAPGI